MDKFTITKILLFGFFTWLIPFAISFLFYTKSGNVIIISDFLKLLMIVIVSITTCYFLYNYFKFIESDFLKNGIIVGLSWFAINIFLDLITLMPMMNLDTKHYFMVIGLRYAIIPVLSTTIAFSLNIKSKAINNIKC